MFSNLNCNLKRASWYYLRNFCSSVKNRLFTDKHDWIVVENNIGTVGISDYAQDKLGDIVYVQLPEIGLNFDQHNECGTVESVKAASEIFSPVSGKIVETNKRLEKESHLINKLPYTDGWIFKISITNPTELNSLMDEKAYNKFLEEDH